LSVKFCRERLLFDAKNILVSKTFAVVYSYGILGPIRNVKEFIMVKRLLPSRKTGVGSLRFFVALEFISKT